MAELKMNIEDAITNLDNLNEIVDLSKYKMTTEVNLLIESNRDYYFKFLYHLKKNYSNIVNPDELKLNEDFNNEFIIHLY